MRGCGGVEQLAAGVGEGDEYAAAVAGVGFAADQASFAEVVDPQRHEMNKLGANYIQAGLWEGFAVRDGNLITGQQNFSGAETAEVIVRALGE